MLQEADLYLHDTWVAVIVTSRRCEETNRLLETIWKRSRPRISVVLCDAEGEASQPIREMIPLLQGKELVNGKPTVYVCRGATCLPPVTTVSELERLLDEKQ